MRCRFPVWETGPYEYLLDIIANVLRAFLRKENVPEEETEETETLVGKVKEKEMGELFANMDKMDLQAERRKTAEAVKRAEEAEKKTAEAYEIGMMKGIIKSCKSLNASREYALSQLQEMNACSRERAEELVERYWED